MDNELERYKESITLCKRDIFDSLFESEEMKKNIEKEINKYDAEKIKHLVVEVIQDEVRNMFKEIFSEYFKERSGGLFIVKSIRKILIPIIKNNILFGLYEKIKTKIEEK